MQMSNLCRVGFVLSLLVSIINVNGQTDLTTTSSYIQWEKPVPLKSMPPQNTLSNKTMRNINALNETIDAGYGSQYCRLLKLSRNKWLAVYTVRTNKGYKIDPQGGLRLEIALSEDNGNTWSILARLKDPGRDLDNGQLIQLPNGHILLACRSVRWQSSYRLPVYESKDGGKNWEPLSIIDYNEGTEGSLGNPDKGVYEPHFVLLKNRQLAVFYANEKHVTQTPSYSQVISERISPDGGKTWGHEIFVAHDPDNKDARPGMPVCTRMKNGDYIAVYEVCGTKGCNIYQKISSDGINWAVGLGKAVPGQTGAPFIQSLTDGRLIITSNRGNISMSDQFGKSWTLQNRPWHFEKPYEQDWQQALWPSVYQFGPDKIGVTAALPASKQNKGHQVTIRFGHFKK